MEPHSVGSSAIEVEILSASLVLNTLDWLRLTAGIPPCSTHDNHRSNIALGEIDEGRAVFVAFTLRQREGKTYIRPISARYMQWMEVEHYEKLNDR
jgi:uncharacterized DUF497 family protein